jgi:hypothetical protein
MLTVAALATSAFTAPSAPMMVRAGLRAPTVVMEDAEVPEPKPAPKPVPAAKSKGTDWDAISASGGSSIADIDFDQKPWTTGEVSTKAGMKTLAIQQNPIVGYWGAREDTSAHAHITCT